MFQTSGVSDDERRFLDFVAGFPGTMHDARILRNTTISRIDEFLENPRKDVDGIAVSPYLLGDSAYPMELWLMKPYSDATTDRKEKKFNYQLSKARVCIEQAFGVLKSRFRILTKRIDVAPAMASKIAVACAVLHNFCIDSGDRWEDQVLPQDTTQGQHVPHDLDAEELREYLKEYVWKQED